MARNVNIDIGGINRTKVAFQSVLRDARRLSRNVSAAAKRAGASMQNIGMRMMQIGTVGGLGVAYAVRSFAQFDDQMARVSAVTNETAENMNTLRERAEFLGATTVFTAKEAAEGMALLGQSGMKTVEILGAIKPVLSLAAAGGVEMAEAAEIAADTMRSFNMEAKELGVVADLIARGATSSNTTVQRMGETFQFVSASANLAGQSIQETSAAIAILANKGQKASIAGTQIDQMMAKLVENKDELEGMGVILEDQDKNFRPLLDILQDLGRQTENMGNVERLGKFHEMFGARAKKAAMILATETNPNVEKFRKLMDNAEGAAETMAEKMLSGLGGAGVRVASAFDGMKNAFVDNLKPALMAAAEQLAKFFLEMRTAFKMMPDLSNVVVGLVGGIAALGAGLVAAGTALSAFGSVAGVVATSIIALASALLSLNTPAGAIGAALGVQLGAAGAAAGVATVKTNGYADALIGLKKVLFDVIGVLKETLAAMRDAFGAGDAGMAMRIAITGMHLTFLTAVEGMYQVAAKFAPLIVAEFKNAYEELGDSATELTFRALDLGTGGMMGFNKMFDNMNEAEGKKGLFEGFGDIFATMGANLGNAKQETRDAFNKLVNDATIKKAIADAGFSMGELIGLGVGKGIEASSPVIGGFFAGIMEKMPNQSRIQAANLKLFKELFPTPERILKAMGSSPDSQVLLGKIGISGIEKPKQVAQAGVLQATQGRLLSGVRSKTDALEAINKQQLNEQKKAKDKLDEIEKNTRDEGKKGGLMIDLNMGVVV
jgi:TP901 family phage tail tape measure protein